MRDYRKRKEAEKLEKMRNVPEEEEDDEEEG